MPTIDLGSVTIIVDDDRVDVFSPREHDEVKNAMKSLKSRWNPERKCWTAIPRFCKKSEEEIVSYVKEAILGRVPAKWPSTVEKFGDFACATKKYEIKFGLAGMRLTLPAGHPCHYKLDKLPGAKKPKYGITWTVPARCVKPSVIIPILQRTAKEDRDAFINAVEPYFERTIQGTIPISPEEAERYRLVEGKIAFADYSFVKEADPQIVNMPVHAWAYRVLSRTDKPGKDWSDVEAGIDVRLGYLEADMAFKAVRHFMSLPEEERPPRLDAPHALRKWRSRY